jgi:hypothetical protein
MNTDQNFKNSTESNDEDHTLLCGVFSTNDWIKEDFNGIIPINTPILQIIPFKRENWKSESREDLVNYAKIKIAEKNKYLSGFYKKFIRQKKTYK